jgi:predicted esterase
VLGAGVAGAASAVSCGQLPRDTEQGRGSSSPPGRLRFRAPPVPGNGGDPGRRRLPGSGDAPAAEVYAPSVENGEPLRLVLVFHGAGGRAGRSLERLASYAARHRLLLLAVQSTGPTWDVIRGDYGPDVTNLDRLLKRISAEYPIKGYTLSGFSDGASYALSLGLTNGDVFDSVIAFSPGFEASGSHHGEPRFFVSHGKDDKVLPIERCSRRLVPRLEANGYDVTYVEFAGGHEVPRDIARRAVNWLTT